MSNTNAPFGLRFLGLMGSPPTNSSMMERRNGILYTNTTAIFTGDLVMQSADGYWYQWTNSTPAYLGYGVFAGCRYYSNSQQTIVPQKYWPGTDAANGTVLAQVVPTALTPAPMFVIQTGSTGYTDNMRGMNCDVVVGTGSTATGFSGSYLDTANLTTATTAPLRIVDSWANWVMSGASGGIEGVGGSSTLVPGTQSGAYGWAVVTYNSSGQQGI